MQTGKTKVAVLLPLTGKSADLGKQLLEAAQMAVFDIAGPDFELLPRDTGDTPDTAVLAAKDALANGAVAIVGPVFATAVTAIKPLTAQTSVPVLALSNDASVAGSGAYVLGFRPGEQVERVLTFARRQNQLQLAALVPSSPYGDRVMDAVYDTVQKSGQTLTRAQRYDRDPTAATRAVLDGADYTALLIPEGGQNLKTIATVLTQRGIAQTGLKLLGTAWWGDDASLQANPALAGAWYAAPSPTALAAFEARYEQTFGHKPHALAALAYDATALVAVLAKGQRGFGPAALTNPRGFSGSSGIFRLRADGLADHGLSILEINPSAPPRVIDASPTAFGLNPR
jgi:branched-chain amino acid transport system substrate-binding protein